MKYLTSLLLIASVYVSLAQTQSGKASYYADRFEGQTTASGEKYKHNKLTAAHKTLPFGTVVKVTNLSNDLSVEVRINDRGPFVEGRVIDLSKSAAEALNMLTQGIADVKLEVVDPGEGKGGGFSTAPISNVTVEERELYNFSVERVDPKGYGVQIGSYRELVNLMRFSENLKSSYRKDVTVQVKVLNGVKIYTLIVGQFPNRDKAEDFKAKIARRYPDAFIVDLSSLK